MNTVLHVRIPQNNSWRANTNKITLLTFVGTNDLFFKIIEIVRFLYV